jgi:hypothetical protein
MDTDALLIFVLIAIGLLVAATLPYLIVETRWRWRWREVEIGRANIHDGGGGLYRAPGTVPVFRRRAPGLVRAAAFTSLLFGQLFVPGLLIGSIGLIAGGIGLVMIPGLITNAKLYSSGLALLRREPRVAYFRARNAVAWALWLNGILFALSVAVMVLLRPWDAGAWWCFGILNGHGLLATAQALLLRRATRVHEDALFAPTEALSLGRHLYRTPAPQ